MISMVSLWLYKQSMISLKYSIVEIPSAILSETEKHRYLNNRKQNKGGLRVNNFLSKYRLKWTELSFQN